jgi:hypothetical protein
MSNTNIINFDGFKGVGTSTKQISATELEVGKTYIIRVRGNTDFIAIGSSSNVVDTEFVATNVAAAGNTGEVELKAEVGTVLSDNFNTWRKKTNGIIEEINEMNVDLNILRDNAALLNRQTIQNFQQAIGGEFKDYGTMTGTNNTLDLKEANIFKFKIASNETLEISELAASAGCSYTLIIESEGAYQITWPSEFKFVNGSGILTQSGTTENPVYDILKFESSGTVLYSSISSYIDNADTEIMRGAATTHYINAYASRITTANAGPASSNVEFVRTAMANVVKKGHFIIARFEQKYTYGTGNGTGTGYRQYFIVYYVNSIAADGKPNLDPASYGLI